MDANVLLKQAQHVYKVVKQKVLNVSPLEALVLECTCNEPWGPHGAALHELAAASRGYEECSLIFAVLRMRMEDTGKDWRHVYKSLAVLEFLVGHGSESAMREVRAMKRELKHLERFQFMDSQGKDQGLNVRHKSQTLQRLLDDPHQIDAMRKKARETKNKYTGVSSSDAGGFGGDGKKYGGVSSVDHFRAQPGGGSQSSSSAARVPPHRAHPTHGAGSAISLSSASSGGSGGRGGDTTDAADEWDAFGAERAAAPAPPAVASSGAARLVVVPPRLVPLPLPLPRRTAGPALNPGPGDAFDPRATVMPAVEPLFGLHVPPTMDVFGAFSAPPAAAAPPAVDLFSIMTPSGAAPARLADIFGDFAAPAAPTSHAAAPATTATFLAPSAAPLGDMFGGGGAAYHAHMDFFGAPVVASAMPTLGGGAGVTGMGGTAPLVAPPAVDPFAFIAPPAALTQLTTAMAGGLGDMLSSGVMDLNLSGPQPIGGAAAAKSSTTGGRLLGATAGVAMKPSLL